MFRFIPGHDSILLMLVSGNITLSCWSVVSCARLATSPCHFFLSSAAVYSWQYFVPLVVDMSVVQAYLLVDHGIFCLLSFLLLVVVVMSYARYCNFLVLNCLTSSLTAPSFSILRFGNLFPSMIFSILRDISTAQRHRVWTTVIF